MAYMRFMFTAAVVLGTFIMVATASTAADPPACVVDSTQPACKSYKYPAAMANQDITDMCLMMSDMSGCTIQNLCKVTYLYQAAHTKLLAPLDTRDICALRPGTQLPPLSILSLPHSGPVSAGRHAH